MKVSPTFEASHYNSLIFGEHLNPVAAEVEKAAQVVGKEVLIEELTEALEEGVTTALEVV